MHQFKSLIKQMLGSTVAKLPYGAKEAILEALCLDLKAQQTIARLAPRAGITAITGTGSYGDIRSSVSDLTIFPIYAKTGLWAGRTNDLLTGFFSGRGGTYIDIGANIGLTTIPVARNKSVRCIAIEPEPTNYANLVANVRLNCPHGNVEIHQVAMFDKATTLKFELAPENLGDHRIHLNDQPGAYAEHNRRVIDVIGLPLRELVRDVEMPLAVKIDTQGAEPFVAAGGREIISQAQLLVIEFWPYGMSRLGADPNQVIDLLREFKSLRIAVNEDEDVSEMPIEEAVEFLGSCAQHKVSDNFFYLDVIGLKDTRELPRVSSGHRR